MIVPIGHNGNYNKCYKWSIWAGFVLPQMLSGGTVDRQLITDLTVWASLKLLQGNHDHVI